MSTQIRGALPLVGLLVLGASCATTQRSASEQANAADERSRQELRQAQEAQQKAADQEKNVAAARQDVVRSQQQLAQAQRKESEERAKLQQLQQQADLHARQAEAARAPAAAAGQTVPPGGPVRSGRQTISGHVLQARPNQLVLQARTGQTLTLDVNDQTQIYVGGERRSADELQQGADARVAYEETGGRPTALTVEVARAAPPAAAGTQQPGTGAPEPELPAQDTRAAPVPGADNPPPAGTQ